MSEGKMSSPAVVSRDAAEDAAPKAGTTLEWVVRGLSPKQRQFVKAGCIHGDFTMATVNALRRKGLFHLVIDSPNGRSGFMRLTPLGAAARAIIIGQVGAAEQ